MSQIHALNPLSEVLLRLLEFEHDKPFPFIVIGVLPAKDPLDGFMLVTDNS